MADDNLSISIGIDLGKMRTDIELLKAEYRKGEAEIKKFFKQAAATGDRSKADEMATSQAALNKQIALGNVELRKMQAAYVGVGGAVRGVATGYRAATAAHEGLRESHSKGIREAISLSREFGNASVSAFSLAKAFREIPAVGGAVAVTAAAVAGAGLAISKTAVDAAQAVRELDNLSKAIGRPQKEIVGLEKIFRDLGIEDKNVQPLLRGLSEQFNKARFAGGGLGSALTGGLVAPRPTTARDQIAGTIAADQAKRRAAGLSTSGVYDDQGRRVSLPEDEMPEPFPGVRTPAFDRQGRVVGRFIGAGAALYAPQPGAFARDIARTGSGFEGAGATTVFRGGEPMQFDPSKGLFGLIDPAAFPNLESAIEAATLRLNELAKINPALGIEIARGTPGGMKPEETLKALQGIPPSPWTGTYGTSPWTGKWTATPAQPVETPLQKAMRETADDPRLRPEALGRSEDFYKELLSTRKTLEDFEIGKGVQMLPAVTTGLKIGGGVTKELEKGWGSWFEQATQPEMGPPLLPGGQSPEGALGNAILDAIKSLFQGPSAAPGAIQPSPIFPTIPGPFQQPTIEQPPTIRLDDTQPLAPQDYFDKSRTAPEPREKFGGIDDSVDQFATGMNQAAEESAKTASIMASFNESLQSKLGNIQVPSSPDTSTALAIGGVVPGYGSGDTVPAWLTPGEYVARRASVDYYGRALFAALNNRMLPRHLFSGIGYATGGLVGGDMGELGSAEGGGRAPVHLHLDGRQFALHGTSGVVDALVAEAGRYQMRSGGLKPSWYGGRPNG